MSKLLRWNLFFSLLSFLPLILSAQGEARKDSSSIAQGKNDDLKLSGDELDKFEKQARQLVSFMEFAFNTLGSAEAEYKDKHTIIEQSYLKFFKNDKVQIEDDLETRDMVTNKDVQAYLKDIDFFFKSVAFKYTIEEINQEINEEGEVFFLIKASRNLKGITIDGKQINENKPRYIEINIDKATRDLKIVSVYTTKSNEVQELITWWNNLDYGWRHYLAAETKVLDTIDLRDVVLIHNDYIVKETLFIRYNDTVSIVDTINVNESKVLPEVRRILRSDEINISEINGIYDLKPLYAFSGLKHLNITGAKIPDLESIRNLSKLETLLASKSLIISLEPIRYIPNLRILDISGTLVNDISAIEDFDALEVLNIADSRVADIGVLKKLPKLRELNLSGLNISNIEVIKALPELQVLELSRLPIISLEPVSQLTKLRRLAVDQTNINTVNDLFNLAELQFLFLDNTSISSISGLEKLPQLKVIYCDKTSVTKTDALAFMQAKPSVKVIYESQELMAWWETLSDDWRKVFSAMVPISSPPTREELHEVSYIKSVDLSNNKLINNLEAIEKLPALTELNISETAISSLKPLSNSFDLQVIRFSKTRISDLSALSGLTSIKEIDLSNTLVTSIEPLVKLPELKTIKMDSTNVSDISLLAGIKRLEFIFADGVKNFPAEVNKIWDSIPGVLTVYQTSILQIWWKNLPAEWKSIFTEHEAIGELPDRIQLHRLVSIKELLLGKNKGINNLIPLNMFQRLETLDISSLQVSDISPLSASHRLRNIDLSNTPVNNLAALAGHKGLKDLNCANSPIEDLQPLTGFGELNKLNISGTQVVKLDPLSSCINLQELDCYNTRINSLKALEQLKSIKVLRAYNTKLSERKIDKFKELHPGAEVIFY
ncbi:MAG TPA: leucine-rich repeat domain-containing protein [Lentimicrobium sp.]|nr:leucine-rich repeat domain-containing protein [Lentimicrobium sp.]